MSTSGKDEDKGIPDNDPVLEYLRSMCMDDVKIVDYKYQEKKVAGPKEPRCVLRVKFQHEPTGKTKLETYNYKKIANKIRGK